MVATAEVHHEVPPITVVPRAFIVHAGSIVAGVAWPVLTEALASCGCYATGIGFGPGQDMVVIRVPEVGSPKEQGAYVFLQPERAKGLRVTLVPPTQELLLRVMAENGYDFRQEAKRRHRAR